MAEIRYTGLPQQFQTGLGDKLTTSWTDFALAKLPQEFLMTGVKNIQTQAAKEATQKQQALQQMMQELQKKQQELQKINADIAALQSSMSSGTQ
jgi:predicted  nucleic acid-binding Zn-ribbon protein